MVADRLQLLQLTALAVELGAPARPPSCHEDIAAYYSLNLKPVPFPLEGYLALFSNRERCASHRSVLTLLITSLFWSVHSRVSLSMPVIKTTILYLV